MLIRRRSPRLLALFAAALVAHVALVVPVPAAPARPVDVSDVRISAGTDSTRVIVELSGNAPHSLTVLKNPDRLVLDVADARLAPDLTLPNTAASGARPASRTLPTPATAGARLASGTLPMPAGAGAVRQVRAGRRPSGELRIVFDLSRPVRAKSYLAESGKRGYRLVIDLSAPASAPVNVEPPRPQGRTLVIAVDAGHGGEDPGAIGKHGTEEKDVVLAIARDLAQRIDGEPGMRAVLTRDGDYFVPLRERMRRARVEQADLFVSIHADSIRDRSVDGSSVYILSQRGATDEASRWLAERQNAADLIGGVSLEDKGNSLASVLLDMSQSASLSASQAAAERVLHQLNRVGEVRKPQVQQARFVVLKSPDIPSMLVETAYISNPQEELRLRGSVHQAKLAEAIHQGLRAYFYDDPPPGTRIAEIAERGPAPVAAPAHPVLATAHADSGG